MFGAVGKIASVVAFLEAHGLSFDEVMSLVGTARADIASSKAWTEIAFDLLVKWKADQGK